MALVVLGHDDRKNPVVHVLVCAIMEKVGSNLNDEASITALLLCETDLTLERCDGLYISESYLVDPASSHMLVSKIKPCMSMHEPNMVKPRMAHYNSLGLLDLIQHLDNCGNSRANTCTELRP